MHIRYFEDWKLHERYRSKNHNLYKVLGSKDPIVGNPVFHEDEMQSFFAVRRKMRDDLTSYEKHMDQVAKKDQEWREKVKGQRGEKGAIAWYDTAKKTRELSMKVVKDSAAFMEKFNKLYDSLKEDLLGTDHVKVAEAIYLILEIYPSSLINEAGKLKRLKVMQIDAQFVKDCLKWVSAISRMYDNLEEAGKLLGKSEKQIEGARKQSFAQRMRWGMY